MSDTDAGRALTLRVLRRSTSTTLVCEQQSLRIGQSTGCTATVTDIAPENEITPTGTVTVTGHQNDGIAGSPCKLSGSGATATCQVRYAPIARSRVGSRTLTGSYSGDQAHYDSRGTTAISAPVLHENLNGESFASGQDNPPGLTGIPCGRGPRTVGFSENDLTYGAFGPYEPVFAVSGTLSVRKVVTGYATFTISDSLGHAFVRGTLSFINPGTYCDWGEQELDLDTDFTYTARIHTAASVLYDSGAGHLGFENTVNAFGGMSVSFTSNQSTPGLVTLNEYPRLQQHRRPGPQRERHAGRQHPAIDGRRCR